jgi:hypothetical protein
VTVGDTAGQCYGRCEASVCGMVARVCVGWWPESVVWCAVCVLVSGEDCVLDVGCDAMETSCEAVREDA